MASAQQPITGTPSTPITVPTTSAGHNRAPAVTDRPGRARCRSHRCGDRRRRGTSAFAGALAQRGFTDITVLELSLEVINAGINRYGADLITWHPGDVLNWRAKHEYRLWHDRAVFHFLTDAPDRQRYREALSAARAPGGAMSIETFAPDGPGRCSGLPVVRCSPASLAHELGPGLALVASGDYEHQTPSGAIQAFIWLALCKDSRDSTPRA